MLEESVYDTCYTDVTAEFPSGNQAADTPYDKVCLDSRLRSLVQPLYHGGVLQGVHFEDNPSLLSAFCQFYLMVDEAVQFGYQIETRYQQTVEYGIFLTLESAEQVVQVVY